MATAPLGLVYSVIATCTLVRLELLTAECAQAVCLEWKTALSSPRFFGPEELG